MKQLLKPFSSPTTVSLKRARTIGQGHLDPTLLSTQLSSLLNSNLAASTMLSSSFFQHDNANHAHGHMAIILPLLLVTEDKYVLCSVPWYWGECEISCDVLADIIRG